MEKTVENKKRVSPRFSKLSTVMVMLLLTLFCQVSQAAAIKGHNKSFSILNINNYDAKEIQKQTCSFRVHGIIISHFLWNHG